MREKREREREKRERERKEREREKKKTGLPLKNLAATSCFGAFPRKEPLRDLD